MKPDKWIWMPHPGHFICSYQCRFHLNTCVGKYIVSTVGELWPERAVREIHAKIHDPKWFAENNHLLGDYFDRAYMKKFGYEDIGCSRKYETMVFEAITSDHKCCPYDADVKKDLDMLPYNTAEDAYKGHLKLCKKWSKK
jgi:hypothetical protein